MKTKTTLLIGLLSAAPFAVQASGFTNTFGVYQKGPEGTVQEMISQSQSEDHVSDGHYKANITVKNANATQISRINFIIESIKTSAAKDDCKVYAKSVRDQETLTPQVEELIIECFNE